MAPNNWSKEELLASVEAYAEMYRKQERGEKFVKKKIYDELSAAFDGKRSSKSFEYRMQNISHVVDELGFDFVKGLKPKQNVGDNVYREIEISIKVLKFLPITKTERLSHNDLYKVKANHIYKAVQKLLSECCPLPRNFSAISCICMTTYWMISGGIGDACTFLIDSCARLSQNDV